MTLLKVLDPSFPVPRESRLNILQVLDPGGAWKLSICKRSSSTIDADFPVDDFQVYYFMPKVSTQLLMGAETDCGRSGFSRTLAKWQELETPRLTSRRQSSRQSFPFGNQEQVISQISQE